MCVSDRVCFVSVCVACVSETGPMMGDTLSGVVARMTLSVVCRFFRESGTRAPAGTRARTQGTTVNITYVLGGAQEELQSGFLGRERTAERGLRLVSKVLFQDSFLLRFVGQIQDVGTEEVSKVFSQDKVGV